MLPVTTIDAMIDEEAPASRAALERRFGRARFRITDDGTGPVRHLVWDCGCVAREIGEGRYVAERCPDHAAG